MSGPLTGFRILELAGQGPGPFAAMLLADLGAEVLRLDRLTAFGSETSADIVNRGRRSVAVDLKTPEGVALVLRLAETADAFIEGFRPGVVERLGIGPDECHGRNRRLVYGRVTGWGQTGPYAQMAGHDVNYIALSGALHMIGPAGGPPVLPVNLLGDYAGGGMLLALGLVSAMLEASHSGLGQTVDAAMLDGAALISTFVHGALAVGGWSEERGTNLLDGGRPFYGVYETADGQYVTVGSIEPQFYGELVQRLGLDPAFADAQHDGSRQADLRRALATTFRSRTQAEWCAALEGTDVCFAPVLAPTDAPDHPHNRQRGTFVEVGGVRQPAPAPRFSRTPAAVRRRPPNPGEHTEEALLDWGLSQEDVDKLRVAEAIA